MAKYARQYRLVTVPDDIEAVEDHLASFIRTKERIKETYSNWFGGSVSTGTSSGLTNWS